MKVVLLIAGASTALLAQAATAGPQTPSPQTDVRVALSGDVESFYGIPMSLTHDDLKRLPFRVVPREETVEGDLQTYHLVWARHGVKVKIVFDDQGKLYVAHSTSSNAVGPKGIGVGSTLSQVKATWPNGKLLYGSEDGRFVTFNTGTNVLYIFSPEDMPPAAFEQPRKEIVVPDLRVKAVRIFAAESARNECPLSTKAYTGLSGSPTYRTFRNVNAALR